MKRRPCDRPMTGWQLVRVLVGLAVVWLTMTVIYIAMA